MTPSSSAAMEVTALKVEPTALVSWVARFINGEFADFLVSFL